MKENTQTTVRKNDIDDNKYYILATSNYADDRTQTLNYGDVFAIFDRWGDIKQIGSGKMGLFYKDTRYISEMEMCVNGFKPVLLSSDIKDDHLFVVDITNPDMKTANGRLLQKSSLYVSRSKFVLDSVLYERITLRNFALQPFNFEVSFTLEADFKDIFEVRGTPREKAGRHFAPQIVEKGIIFSYQGLDHIARKTHICFDPPPQHIEPHYLVYQFHLEPAESFTIEYSVRCIRGDETIEEVSYGTAYEQLEKELGLRQQDVANFYSDNELFNNWINQSGQDLLSLVADTPYGEYPYAGVPWYNTAFGRDGIITALSTLWMAPHIAKGVLFYLARTQADEKNSFRDSEPGKILHETRQSEMADTGEVPFGCYYGTVDATPLFVMLAGRYFRRTNDIASIEKLWSNICRALEWIDNYGDKDKDGFVEYQHESEKGLYNQGWKDSHDSIMHADGSLAKSPIALCEVQGYVYEAKLLASEMAVALGDHQMAERLKDEAGKLKKHFNEVFWDDELGTYVLALDGDKKPCRVKASNAGHCLYTGIANPDKAQRTIRCLMSDALFSGWGIRTLAEGEVRYNPMSYHNGSVWPHDSAIAAAGMSRYGFKREAVQVLTGMFEAALFLESHRLPELFCGFRFRRGQMPVLYPVACSPQAWAVASVFLMLQACLHLEIDAKEKCVAFDKPQLPEFFNKLKISNIILGEEKMDIELFCYQFDTGFHIIDKPDDWEIIVKK